MICDLQNTRGAWTGSAPDLRKMALKKAGKQLLGIGIQV